MSQTVMNPKLETPRGDATRKPVSAGASARAAAASPRLTVLSRSAAAPKGSASTKGPTPPKGPATARALPSAKPASAKLATAKLEVRKVPAVRPAVAGTIAKRVEHAVAADRGPAAPWKKPSKEEAYVRYAPLVKYVVDRIASNVPKYVERDDLLNAAALGLFDALEKYDAAKGTKFETYAVWRIRGAVLDELRSMDWASRSVRRKARQLDSVCRELDQKLGRQATEHEIAAQMDVTTNQFGRILDEVRGVVLLSLNQPASENEETGAGGLAELIEDTRATNALDKIEKEEMKDVLLDVFNQLTEPEKLVLALYYYEEMTLKEIGETLDISESRASQIHTKAIGRVRRRLGRTMQGAA